MKRNTKIIQITGFRGLLIAAFIAICLGAGFIAFPGFAAMSVWNHISGLYSAFPEINLLQGVLLWAIIAMVCYLANGKKFAIAIHRPAELNDEEMSKLMEKIKLQSKAKMLNSMILKQDEKNTTEQNETNVISCDEEIHKEKL